VSENQEKSYTYKDAGVDIDAGEALVDRIKPMAKSTRRAGSDASLGGFGGLFDLKAAGYNDPILVAATDGVGTKLKVALEAGRHNTVGIDLVAMCVNDLIVQGAEPLLFLDYMATGHLDVDQMADVVDGIAEGCRQANSVLIGGETAEMPGMYDGNDYDLAGFSVGAAERGTLLDGSTVADGDVILGLASSGIHSNGYSLVRRIVTDMGLDYNAPAPFDDSQLLGEALLTPTKIYVRSCMAAVRAGFVKSFCHITGGGFLENIPRSMPTGTRAHIDTSTWDLGPIFGWLANAGNIKTSEMARTFNCGVGMAVFVAEADVAAATALFEEHGETVYRLGHVSAKAPDESDAPTCVVTGPAGHWGADAAWSAETGEE